MNTSRSFLIVLCFLSALFITCQKETSCESCLDTNKPPIAFAGDDQLTILPKDSVLLDGSSSSDTDGRIIRFHWTKVEGPTSYNFNHSDSSRTIVGALVEGVYHFQLNVMDDKNAIAKDTILIRVSAGTGVNVPPIANAGSDQIITLPVNGVELDGSASSDPDGTITSYSWIQIAGPASSIINSNADKIQVANMLQGVYQFELKVTDNGGLFSNDTVQVTVNAVIAGNPCDIGSRKQVIARLSSVGGLSQIRDHIAVASANNKIVYAGGFASGIATGRVDIFNPTSNTWSYLDLKQPRGGIIATVLGNKIYLAGGYINGNPSYTIDVYDAAANVWSAIILPTLTTRDAIVASGAAGNKVVFLSGSKTSSAPTYTTYTFVDIFDIVSNNWSHDTLHDRTHFWPTHAFSDAGMATTVIGNKIFFAGNASDWFLWDYGSITSVIDIYDASTNSWSKSDLKEARGFLGGIAVGTKNYWAGGVSKQLFDPWTNQVEIRDMNTGSSTFACLFQPNALLSAVEKNSKIVFFTPTGNFRPPDFTIQPVHNKFDIYDITTNTWSIGVLPLNIYGASLTSLNNTIYVAGGYVNGVISFQVWTLEF